MYRRIIIAILLVFMSISITVAQDDSLPEDLPGRIAYVGEDANVYVLNLAADELITLTDDATATRRYQWPTWATNGKLAYFCCDPATADEINVQVYISADGFAPGEEVYSQQERLITYMYWAPADCDSGNKCRDLALLLGGGSAFDVRLVRDSDSTSSDRLLGRGSPFYYSWSPDGGQLLTQRNNQRFDIFEVEAETSERLEPSPGLTQAPSWSPVDERVLIGVLDIEAQATDLVVVEADDTLTVLAEDVTGFIGANWSPDGQRVAYRTLTEDYNDIFVLDAVNGEVVTRTREADVIAFFWSPDSSKIAYVTPATTAGSISTRAQQPDLELSWSILDTASGETWRYPRFTPTNEMIYMFNFFDQFAQSHSFWSPDSTHLVFAEVVSGDTGVISLLDTEAPDAVPFSVANGVIGIWSYR